MATGPIQLSNMGPEDPLAVEPIFDSDFAGTQN